MLKDVYGLTFGDTFGPPEDPLGLSWGLFEETGNTGFYMLYSNLFNLEEIENEDRFE